MKNKKSIKNQITAQYNHISILAAVVAISSLDEKWGN